MESAALHALLHQLLAAWENEVVEFKEASKDYKTAEIFQYFSALSNEANLRGANSAWLVFGVRNKDKQIVGTDFRLQHDHLHSLKQQVKQSTGSISFREIHELIVEGKRVLLFEIPPAPRGMPVFANGHAYARAGESLKGLDMFQLDTIRNQTLAEDWSAQLVDGATTADLDQRALQKARQDFIQKHANRLSAEEVMGWSEEAFLGKLRLLHKNKLTRAALLLFGKPEASVFLRACLETSAFIVTRRHVDKKRLCAAAKTREDCQTVPQRSDGQRMGACTSSPAPCFRRRSEAQNRPA